MKLSKRLAISMIVLVFVTAGIIGLITYSHLEKVIIPLELERLSSRVDTIPQDMEVYVRNVSELILATSQTAGVEDVVSAYSSSDIVARKKNSERLAQDLTAHLKVLPVALQFRLIGMEKEGREIVRVDRSGPAEAIRVVPEDGLQSKGSSEYFRKAISLPVGELYVSPVELNREYGKIEVPHVPVLRVATPVYSAGGKPFGILIINVDMRPLFASMRAKAPNDTEIYLVNESGDFVMHPDPSKEFGRELGRPILARDEFPELIPLLTAEAPDSLLFTGPNGNKVGAACKPIVMTGGLKVITLATISYAKMMAAAERMGQYILYAAAVACIFAVVIALGFARTISRPLAQMTEAVAAFPDDKNKAVPVEAEGEIGLLA